MRRSHGSRALEPIGLPTPHQTAADIRALFEDSAGRIWVGTRMAGAYLVDRRNHNARAIRAPRGELSIDTAAVTAIVAAQPGEIWIATGDLGILAVDSRSFHIRHINHDPDIPSSLASNSVLALFRDRAGSIWVATTRSISRCDVTQADVTTVFGPARDVGLTGTNVIAVLREGDQLWAGLARDGADLLDPSGEHGFHLRFSGSEAQTGAHAVARAPDGAVMFGTHAGLFRLTHDTHGPAARVPFPKTELGLGVRSLFAAMGRMWIVMSDDALWILDAAGRPVPFSTLPHSAGLTDSRVTVVAPGPRESVWIGTQHGLNRFEFGRGVVERILPGAANPHALSSGLITSILTDRSGRVWIGTQGGGIDVITGHDQAGRPRFARIGVGDGLPNDDVDMLLADRSGDIWASTDNGIVRIDSATFAVRVFDQSDGAGILGYWNRSGATDRDQRELIFGGLGGLTVIRPDLLTSSALQPPLVVTDVTVGGKALPPGRFFGQAGSLPPLTVEPDANSLSVGFAALDFAHASRNRYAYRLTGFDTNWNVVDTSHRFASYTNVPAGDYKLEIRSSNESAGWNGGRLVLVVRVIAAWYQTTAFRLCAIAAACALIIMFIQIRTAYLRRRQGELEREVAARTAELVQTQRQLEQIAYFDTLTALPNRRMFSEDFRKLIALANRQDVHFGLILLDLDGFKNVNDRFGHDVGDAVLVEAAARLRSSVRTSDSVARLGGDEFAILLTSEYGHEHVERICDRIVKSFEADIETATTHVRTATSIGVAVFPQDGTTQEMLYKSADLALYDAKRSGRNTWRWYRAELRA